MALFHWSDKYSVKIKSIDVQHKRLFDLANQVHELLQESQAQSKMRPIINELLDYTVKHFLYEERLLEENGYSELEKHQDSHDTITEKVGEYKTALEQGKEINVTEMLTFIVDWLQDHILKTDFQYTELLVSKGVQ